MTAELRENIRVLTASGTRQDEIARDLGVHRNTVYRAQKRLGLHAKRQVSISAELEKEILHLLRKGHGTSWIGKHLACGEHVARLVKKRCNFRRKPSVSDAKRTKIIAEIQGHRNFGIDLASKYRVSYKLILRLAHEVLECPRFRPGRGEPLTSDWPQKEKDFRV